MSEGQIILTKQYLQTHCRISGLKTEEKEGYVCDWLIVVCFYTVANILCIFKITTLW